MTETAPAAELPSGLSKYVRSVQKFPMLSAEEELELARRWRDRQEVAAADRLVTSHMRLVVRIASDFRGYGISANDLIGAGNIGLMRAVRRYDPDRGFRFATYAMWWIRAAMQEQALHSRSLVKMGTTAAQKKLFFNLRRMKAEMHMTEGTELRPEQVAQIARALNVQGSEVVEMNRRLAASDFSLNAPLATDGDGEWQDVLANESASQETAFGEREETDGRLALLPAALKTLNERELHILRERRLKDEPATLEELSHYYGVSRERIRQIEMRALEKLRKSMRLQRAQRAAGPLALVQAQGG